MNIADSVPGDDFWKELEEIKKTAESFQRQAERSVIKNPKTLMEKVEYRSMFARIGCAKAAIFEGPFTKKGAAAQRDPPVEDGITHCVLEIQRIVMQDYEKNNANFSAVSVYAIKLPQCAALTYLRFPVCCAAYDT